MKKEDFEVKQNEFQKDSENPNLTESVFFIVPNEAAQKEVLEYLKKANPEHASLNSSELENRNPEIIITAVKKFWENDYQGSELHTADFDVRVENPFNNLAVVTDYTLPEFEKIQNILEEVIADYETEHYHELPEKFADVKLISIQTEEYIDNNFLDSGGHYTKDNYDVQTDEVLFTPQPDGNMQRTFIDGNPYSDGISITSVTPEEMTAEIKSAMEDSRTIVAVQPKDGNPISYQDWEQDSQMKEKIQKQAEYSEISG